MPERYGELNHEDITTDDGDDGDDVALVPCEADNMERMVSEKRQWSISIMLRLPFK